jgi:hypothetical protein
VIVDGVEDLSYEWQIEGNATRGRKKKYRVCEVDFHRIDPSRSIWKGCKVYVEYGVAV